MRSQSGTGLWGLIANTTFVMRVRPSSLRAIRPSLQHGEAVQRDAPSGLLHQRHIANGNHVAAGSQ
ncbi:MAG: hypothetical protein LBT00_02255 [Spirochaetaceae bacterium]|nr:hypothetical protein [Spirochaetaceae bacterium]